MLVTLLFWVALAYGAIRFLCQRRGILTWTMCIGALLGVVGQGTRVAIVVGDVLGIVDGRSPLVTFATYAYLSTNMRAVGELMFAFGFVFEVLRMSRSHVAATRPNKSE